MLIDVEFGALSRNSKQIVRRKCDRCEVIESIEYRNIYLSRSRRKSNADYCVPCARELASINRRNGICSESNGYLYFQRRNRRVFVHTQAAEDGLGRKLTETECVHHIDGNKTNNDIDNLFVFENHKQHMLSHNSIEEMAFQLFKRGVIGFNKLTGRYYLIQNNVIPISYGFEHIAISQKKNIIKSRLDADISSEIIRGIRIKIPIIASNMSTVVHSDFCIKLYDLGALGVMHRADDESFIVSEVRRIADRCQHVAASIGITEDQVGLCASLVDGGANIIFIDVAHGYSDFVLNFGRKIKSEFGVKVVVGNTTNTEMFKEASDFADAIKVGIAQGYACETKNTAGCTEKQFSAVLKFKELSQKYGIPIISDGGIREPADFTKAIGAGASSIMAGKIFAECPESAAEIVMVNDVEKKLYAGMASEYVQNLWKGMVKEGTCTEGGVRYLDIGMPVAKLLERYSGALRSGISYSGSCDIRSFQDNVEFVRIA